MIKAMLIVASLGLNVEMPNMDSCLEARLAIENQDPTIKTLCVPKANETDKVREMFDIFLNVIGRIKEYEEIERFDFNENRSCEECVR